MAVEESIRIQTFNEVPSAEEFASHIEPKNVPTVFEGCVKNWKAFSKWNPSNGGLAYLQELVGSTIVEVMLSRSAPVFYGDIRSHERVPLPFSTFIGYCMDLLQDREDGEDNPRHSHKNRLEVCGIEQTDCCIREAQQIYLAQVPILNSENEEAIQLKCLSEDIHKPVLLGTKSMASVNLWMNSAKTRSSTHYDPHNNLLCIVSGCKQVSLWPPSASPFLYPLPLYGEASNHSAVTLENPNLSLYPRAKYLNEYSQKVILHAGDALFIPEGWFHQVDSENLTIAVNFWWRSKIMSDMLEHMDAYYMRRILKRLTDKEMNQRLHQPSITVGKIAATTSGQPCIAHGDHTDPTVALSHGHDSLNRNRLKQNIMLQDLEPLELQSLHELVSLVHDHVNEGQPVGCSSIETAGVETNDQMDNRKEVFHNCQEDPVANLIWTLNPLMLRIVFVAMAHNFPRTLEALVLHALSPLGAEILTRKFEEMDQIVAEEDRNHFYQIFYGVFDDQFAAMDALLNRKEAFACQAFKNVLDQYLGVNLVGPKPQV
ncbi:uncharacterized protein LOC116016840 [Ipomoea triloba]|uniref:uncharacterized protein LOC116016840 n=1 Tax=Ipomoea triloba TaxID=35885 RepID=UPI00125E84A9|nr:uncharacterized protein LOC116016840 [Ipomoea triloba]